MVRQMNRSFRSLCVACGLVVTALVSPAQGDEIWVAPTHQADLGGLGIASNVFWPVTPIGVVRLAWGVPNDLQTFQSAKLVLIPHAPGGAGTLNLFVCRAQNSDLVGAACIGPAPHAFTGVTNRLLEIDVSGIIGAQVAAAGLDYLAVLAYTTPTTATDHIVGLRFEYEPTAPAGVATLGANTFTGAQTAPAFVGSGAGLTNLPFPSGAATLGANTFSGTQTAPAFIGSGAGVTNVNADLLDGLNSTAFAATLHGHDVSQVTGAARLAGGNVFTGTQTIDAGNLDLDLSSATGGNLTKNGAPLLHTFGVDNTFLGTNAGNFTLTGDSNSALGVGALVQTTSGYQNTASGVNALSKNTTGFGNAGHGSYALFNNTTGAANTASGYLVLFNNTTGNNNVALGNNAGSNATTGSNNIYLGANVFGNAGESNSMYFGQQGLHTKTIIGGIRGTTVTGGEMVVIDAAGRLGSGAVGPGANSVGTAQVIDDSLTASDLAPNAVTASELAADSVTSAKVAFNYAGSASEGGPAADVVCVGCVQTAEVGFEYAGSVSKGGPAIDVWCSGCVDATEVSFGYAGSLSIGGPAIDVGCLGCVDATEVSFSYAGTGANTFTATQTIDAGNLDLDDSTATTGNITKSGLPFLHTFGFGNTFLGVNAGNFTMTGVSNTASGAFALFNNTTGEWNTAGGHSALFTNTTGYNNTATGGYALFNNTTGAYNTSTGGAALEHNTTGGFNVATGFSALDNNTTGNSNTGTGYQALVGNTTGGSNVAVGKGAGANATTGSNNIYLGANVLGVAGESNTMYLGLQGTQTKTVIAGVRDKTTGVANAIPVVIDSNGQLGTISSSRRFKEDIHDMPASLGDRLLGLRPVTFRYSQAFTDGSKPIQYGLVAEEVADVFPELAVRNAAGEIETVHYETLNVLLLKQFQEQQAQLRLLQEQVKDLMQSRDSGK